MDDILQGASGKQLAPVIGCPGNDDDGVQLSEITSPDRNCFKESVLGNTRASQLNRIITISQAANLFTDSVSDLSTEKLFPPQKNPNDKRLYKENYVKDENMLEQARQNFGISPGPNHAWIEHIGLNLAVVESGTWKKFSHHGRSPRHTKQTDFCVYCAILFRDWSRATEFVETLNEPDEQQILFTPFFDDIRDIRSSACNGCVVCQKLISVYDLRPINWNHPSRTFPNGRMLLQTIHLRGYKRFWVLSFYISTCLLGVIQIQSSTVSSKIVARQSMGECTGFWFGCFPNALQLAQQWVSTCNLKHKDCMQPRVRTIPLRLVHVLKDSAKLCITFPSQNLEYTTLSHCWGRSNPAKLLRNNLLEFMENIPWHVLSKTFLDAMNMTSRLGFEYLWIDSLCIIQDDHDDWTREASNMASIYGSAVLNIAASAANDGTEGCIFKRNHVYTENLCINVCSADIPTTLCLSDYNLVFSNISESPLAKRAWCFQERVLARRNLFFTKTQLFWECNEAFSCESFPNDDISLMFHTGGCKGEEFWKTWYSIVHDYTCAQLGFPQDKSMAIAGIAREFARRRGHTYIAGMWRETLLHDLCWRAGNKSARRIKPVDGIRYPTWSWLSLDNDQINLIPPFCSDLYAQITDVDLPLRSIDPFGNKMPTTLALEMKFLLPATYRVGANFIKITCLRHPWPHKCDDSKEWQQDMD